MNKQKYSLFLELMKVFYYKGFLYSHYLIIAEGYYRKNPVRKNRIMEGEKLTYREAYEAMILMLYNFHKETGSTDLTDVLSGGEYIDGEPADIAFWYRWEESIESIKSGDSPKVKKWI